MDSLQINTGEKRIAINDDPERVIIFNPSDVVFAERFYNLIGEFESKLTEYQTRSKTIDANTELDANKIPVNAGEKLALLREACEYVRERIDHLFGKGTSQKAFGDTLNIDLFKQFFDGISPFIQRTRADKIAKYTTVTAIKKRGRKSK